MMIGSEIFSEFLECSFDAVDRLIDDDGIFFIYQAFEHRLASFLHREKSEIEILMTVDTTCNQC